MCQCCGRPFVSQVASQAIKPLCRLCRTNFYAFDRARSFAIYGETVSQAISLLKYEEITRLGIWFADRLAEQMSPYGEEWQADVTIPVPLHPERYRERGYNQAELIARQVAKRLAVPIRTNLLMRIKPRPPQLFISRNERWKCVRGAYATRNGLKVDKVRVLLIDDVMTTGATSRCMRPGAQEGGGYFGTGTHSGAHGSRVGITFDNRPHERNLRAVRSIR